MFARSWSRNDITLASPVQVMVDCFTGAGRVPADGEALLDWLRRCEPRWRATSLTPLADLP